MKIEKTQIVNCIICGKEFETIRRKTCSSECRRISTIRTKKILYGGENALKILASKSHNTNNIRINDRLNSAKLLTIEEVHNLLLSKEYYYKKYFGKAKNRTFINDNIDLYKSLLFYTDKFKNKKVRLNLTCRLILAAEYNFDISKILCKCRSKILYNPETQSISKTLYCKKCCPGPNTIIYFILKYGEIEGKIQYDKFIENNKQRNFYKPSFNNVSKASIIFFDGVVSNTRMQHLKDLCLYNRKEKTIKLSEYEISLLKDNNIKREAFYIDFTCNNVIIEFNGIYWHSKTQKYDELRYNILQDRGYSVLYVDERDYMNNLKETTEKTIDFILKNYNKDVIWN